MHRPDRRHPRLDHRVGIRRRQQRAGRVDVAQRRAQLRQRDRPDGRLSRNDGPVRPSRAGFMRTTVSPGVRSASVKRVRSSRTASVVVPRAGGVGQAEDGVRIVQRVLVGRRRQEGQGQEPPVAPHGRAAREGPVQRPHPRRRPSLRRPDLARLSGDRAMGRDPARHAQAAAVQRGDGCPGRAVLLQPLPQPVASAGGRAHAVVGAHGDDVGRP